MNITNAEQVLKSYCKNKGYEKPIYTIVSRQSVNLEDDVYRKKYYTYSVKVSGQFLANGDGVSKRIAKKKAAMLGLQNLRLLELSHMFSVFNNEMPKHRAIGFDNQGNSHPSNSNSNNDRRRDSNLSIAGPSSIEIEEMLTIENAFRPPLLANGKGKKFQLALPNPTLDGTKKLSDKSYGINKNGQDPSEDLILAAIAKLRSYDETIEEQSDSDENENEKTSLKQHLGPGSSGISSHPPPLPKSDHPKITFQNSDSEDDEDEDDENVKMKQIRMITEEIASLDLNNNNNNKNNNSNSNNRNKNLKFPNPLIHHNIQYIDDAAASAEPTPEYEIVNIQTQPKSNKSQKSNSKNVKKIPEIIYKI